MLLVLLLGRKEVVAIGRTVDGGVGEILGRLEGEGRDMLFGFIRQLFVSLTDFQSSPEEIVAKRVAAGPFATTVSSFYHHEDARVC